nr:hypothetical protein [Proteus mirabilis]
MVSYDSGKTAPKEEMSTKPIHDLMIIRLYIIIDNRHGKIDREVMGTFPHPSLSCLC